MDCRGQKAPTTSGNVHAVSELEINMNPFVE